ncbi:Ldh family oxidoreductase [Paradevosia shaoguanensis]|uniref:Ldh family oxidoreductase n=1 Tax=Paradevosia shaoguanensis TaxID=1335043 RepID=UPI0019331362|nr:Ldh family oxidoreductase [Paradevosia shaoguanensis]
MTLVPVSEARAKAEEALLKAGADPDNAALQADLLIEAELRGVPSHGLLRLERLIRRIGNGAIDPRTRGRHDWRGDGLLHVDGQNGLGPVVARAALDAISERARRLGVAAAAIVGSNHIGMLSYYVETIATQGQVAIALTTSEALVHPYGGRTALLGTNPIAIGVPTSNGPFVIDLATSLVSMGEIHDRAHRGQPIPEGWALDAEGEPTTDPEKAKHGAIAPFGGAKGYALGLAFELMVSSLAGAALGRDVRGTLDDTAFCNKGDLFIVIEGNSGQGEALSRYLDLIRQTPPEAGYERVLIPNERALAQRAERLETGLPIADAVWNAVLKLSEEGKP